MEAYQENVIAEKDELNIKIQKLDAFICSKKFEEVSPKEHWLLVEQLIHMREYYNVLIKRIELFNNHEGND